MSMTQLGRVVAGEDPRLRRYQRIELDMESFLVWFKSLDGVIRPEGHGLPKDFNVIAVQTRFDMAGRHMVDITIDRKSTRLNSSHIQKSRMPSSA